MKRLLYKGLAFAGRVFTGLLFRGGGAPSPGGSVCGSASIAARVGGVANIIPSARPIIGGTDSCSPTVVGIVTVGVRCGDC